MIPHKLQLKNFLSYGTDFQEIDFRPYHLIYLSGRNGHGKSALLDAMTWAVWGVARKTTNAVRADQGLLRLGQLSMAVIFDFEVNGQLYRVKREFLKTHNKPLSQLEFGLLNPETESFVALTDKTIRATQAKIEQTIKLDFESFVNSAFLRQGNANEFSKKSPKERKEVLSYILGLQQFDRLKKRALEKVKEIQLERASLQALKDSHEKQLAQKQELEKLIAACDHEQKESATQAKVFAETKKSLDQERKALSDKERQKEMLAYKLQQLHKLYVEKRELFLQQVSAWRTTHKKQRHMPDVKSLDEKVKQLKAVVAQDDQSLKKEMQLQKDELTAKQALEKRVIEIEKMHTHELQKNALLKERATGALKNVEQAIAQHTKELDQLKKEQGAKEKQIADHTKKRIVTAEYDRINAQFEKRKEAYYRFVAQRDRFEAEQQTLIKKQQMVSSEDPSCPLCEQNLSAARKKFLKNKCLKEAKFSLHQYERVSRIVPKLKALLVAQHAQIEAEKKSQTELQALQKECAELDAKCTLKAKELHAFDAQSKAAQKELDAVAKREKELNEYAKTAREKDAQHQAIFKECVRIAAERKALGYDEKLHAQHQKALQEIEKERESLFALQQEVIKQSERKHLVAELAVQLRNAHQQKVALEKEQAVFAPLSKELDAFERTQKEYEKRLQEYAQSREQLKQKQGALQQKKEHLSAVEKELKQQDDAIKKLELQMSDYQEIAAAAGKDGIQALLIEDAIPEIEQEANALLSRLTNNQSHIAIESLRDLKRGGTKETLDINISDPSGIRPYEMFSGGEAFRIDFALRIAISKLLARRAGTSLQTLIIDEGFGSQDEHALSLIMDVIHEVQGDFEKVIVVSHLPAMRDQFPVHFHVEKKPSGSCVNVIELG